MLFNGGLNVSVLDGWWAEAWSPDVGWALGDGDEDNSWNRDSREADSLYCVLECEVVSEFYDRDAEGIPRKWLKRLSASMSRLTSRFSSDRMVKDYTELAYLPAAATYEFRSADGARIASELQTWHEHLAEHWHGMHFGEIRVSQANGFWSFDVQVYLGELTPAAVRVQLYADAPAGARPVVAEMLQGHPLAGAANGFVYSTIVPADRPAEDFTPRIVPYHEHALIPAEARAIYWAH